MKTIGMLGGMSWESTATYYQLINEGIKTQLGGLHSAKIILHSVDFAEIEKAQKAGQWEVMAEMLGQAASQLQASGADFILICTNTMHKIAPEIGTRVTLPLLHIADATAEQLRSGGIECVGLLGTRFTMEEDFYKKRLSDHYGMTVYVPESNDRDTIHNIIYQELCRGIFLESSLQAYIKIIEKLTSQGAQAVILGCTEIALLVKQEHVDTPLYDTTLIHAQAAVKLALENHE